MHKQVRLLGRHVPPARKIKENKLHINTYLEKSTNLNMVKAMYRSDRFLQNTGKVTLDLICKCVNIIDPVFG